MPFESMHFSPFLTLEKSGAPHRKVIVELSYPSGLSVNVTVPADTYLNTFVILTLPTIDSKTQK